MHIPNFSKFVFLQSHGCLRHLFKSLNLFFILFFLTTQNVYAAEVIIREDFNNLEDWKPYYFPESEKYSSYTIESNNDNSYLKAESNDSISAVFHQQEFDVYRYPIVRWRWKVENIYKNGDAKTRAGDDYPLRVYILFKIDTEKFSFWQKIKYNSIKMIYGGYPPHSTLCYIWANKNHKEMYLSSTYNKMVKLVLLQKGGQHVGKWLTEEENVLEDYQQAFGNRPPKMASIAVINDSDNTGESSVSFLDFIEIKENTK